jgi:hypothetical protein
MQYVNSLTDVLSGYLDWHLSRLKLMARFTSSVLTLTTTNLWKVSLALKADVEQGSNYRRIQRFLSGYEVDFTMLGGLLLHLLPQTPPYEVIIDRTEWYFGETAVNILMVGIAHKGMSFPITWSALSSGGGSGAKAQTEVLERFLEVVDPDSIKVITADREFISVPWIRKLQDLDIPFAIRLRSDRRIGRAPEGPSLPARMFARTVSSGSERVLEGMRYLFGAQEAGAQEEEQVPVTIVMRRIGDEDAEDPFLILATSGINPSDATALYERRWEILALFAALKSRGFDLEETHVTEPSKVENLIGLLALAFGWARLVGEERAARQGGPSTKSHGRKERSLFRYGLDRLQNILSTPEPQDEAFFRCLAGLRSPSVFVAGGHSGEV